MAENGESAAEALAELRARIDAIDEEMHRLLMARGEVIDSLIRIKGTSRPGNAFRPGREAAMMRRLVARHTGALPITTVEHIWREIITTFTRIQAPFDVAIDINFAPDRMRDLARFYFGFSVNLEPLSGPVAVIAHVAETSDLGLVAVEQPVSEGAWWRGLAGPSAPRIMALLPFIGAEGRPADLPAFVISPRLADPTPADFRLVAISGKEPRESIVLARAGDERLVAMTTEQAGKHHGVEIGGIARGIAVDTGSALYERAAAQGAR
jgi:chorismate mutase / prephenate dehydratase